MNILMEMILQNTYISNRYLLFIVVLILIYLIAKILLLFGKGIFMRLAKKTKSKVDDLIIERTHKPLVGVLVLLGFKLAIELLELPDEINLFLLRLFESFIIIYITVIIIRVLNIFVDEWGRTWAKKTKSSIDDELLPIVQKTVKIVLILFAIIFLLKKWSVDVSGLLAGVGIAGLAISFALKDSLANIFGGISIILDKTYRIDDIVKIDGGESGKILNIGLRSTRIKNWDGEVVIIPNSIMANSKLVNVMQPDPRIRINIEFGVAYGSDPEKVKRITVKTIKAVKGVSDQNDVKVWFMNMGDFSLNFKAMFWVDDIANKWDIHQKAINTLYKTLNKERINIPFPTTTVHIKK